jgi:septum formation protein
VEWLNIVAAKTLILASSSPRRQELIQALQLPVRICASHVNEETDGSLSPEKIVEVLSLRKAESAAEQFNNEADQSMIVIGSDTIVVMGDRVLGKPKDKQDALNMLELLQGKWHQVYSGIACVDMETGYKLVKHRMTKVKMKSLNSAQIRRYVDSGESMDKAGSYAIQGLGSLIVESIEGCYYNVVGLPLSLLSDMLAELGIEVI